MLLMHMQLDQTAEETRLRQLHHQDRQQFLCLPRAVDKLLLTGSVLLEISQWDNSSIQQITATSTIPRRAASTVVGRAGGPFRLYKL